MKKPNIEDGIGNCAHINGIPVKSEMINEMIDALIESTKLLEHLKSVETEAELLNQIEQQIEMNKYSALKKAGCL